MRTTRATRGDWSRSFGVILVPPVLTLVLFAGAVRSSAGQAGTVAVVAENHWTSRVVAEMAARQERDGDMRVTVDHDRGRLAGFIEGDYQVLAWTDHPTTLTKSEWLYGFRRAELEPTAVFVGQAKLAVIVNRANPVAGLSAEQLQEILKESGRGLDWARVGGQGGRITCYGEPSRAGSRRLLRRACLQYETGRYHTRCYFPIREDFVECVDADDVVRRVRRDRGGIGFVLWTGESIEGVRVVPVSLEEGGPLVELEEGGRIQEEYPLSERLILYLHPTQPDAAVRFAAFATSPAGSEIAESFGLATPHTQRQAEGEARVRAMREGAGDRVSMIGIDAGRSAFHAAAVEYVRAKAAIQLSYGGVDDDVLSIRAFVRGGVDGHLLRELLVLDDRPSARAMEQHGEEWNALMPDEFCIAGRATAIIVNRANRLESLTMGQLKAIFSGEANDWRGIGETGLAVPGGQTTVPINRFSVPRTDPAAAVFVRHCLPASEVRGVTGQADTAAVVAAVGMDPNAIGIVDLASLPGGGLSPDALVRAGQTVRVVPIRHGAGELAQVVAPTPANIRSAMYPLSERVYLYVHPRASDVAKDFARFMATCGGSEATPYADPVRATMDAYVKGGLIPLGDAALDRVAKDEIEAAGDGDGN